jgi:hypothetical protein
MADYWARERARAVVNSIGYIEDPETAIAAALQQVADEAAGLVERRDGFLVFSNDADVTVSQIAKFIRAKFPKEGE